MFARGGNKNLNFELELLKKWEDSLFLAEKIQILEYRIANPEKSYSKIAEFFQQEFCKKVDHTVVYRIMKDRVKLKTHVKTLILSSMAYYLELILGV